MSTDAVVVILEHLRTRGTGVLEEYQAAQHQELWRDDSRLYRAFVGGLISSGHPMRAFELVREGLVHHPHDAQLHYLRALALARGGSVSRARQCVDELLRRTDLEVALRVEALALAGRLEKDRYARAQDEAQRLGSARAAASFYEAACLGSRDHYPTVNAATMWLLAGEPAKAKELAARILETSLGREQPNYWEQATLAEACVIVEDQERAADYYAHAVEAAAGRLGDIASMRRNLQLLGRRVALARGVVEPFDLGTVVAFAGHMIDPPGREVRFPADLDLEQRVAAAIEKELDAMRPVAGYCSAACGADILFAERMLDRGAELHVVLPFDAEDFYGTSVDYGLPSMAQWRSRFDAVLAQAAAVHHATPEKYLGDELLFQFAGEFVQGLALTRAAEIGLEACALAVLDPSSPASITAQFVDSWRRGGRKARTIDLAVLRGQRPAGGVRPPLLPAPSASAGRRQVKAMLFGDVKNFSKLREEQAPTFFLRFLTEVMAVIRESPTPPLFRNTWGDGLFLVFDDVVRCADFGLRLLQQIEGMEFGQLGLPADTGLRVGVHAGPVYRDWDPVIERESFFGSHVTRAARIEPVTVPGCVFASEQFAALLATRPGHPFVCEYVGIEELAKGYGRSALYHVRRGEPAASATKAFGRSG